MPITLDILCNAKQHAEADSELSAAIISLNRSALLYLKAGKTTHYEKVMRKASSLRRMREKLKLVV